MINMVFKVFLFLAIPFLILYSADCLADDGNWGGWDYHGSGRDHPYSAYIDRATYVGYAEYRPIPPQYLDGPIVFSNVLPAPPVTPAPGTVVAEPQKFIVNIPNAHGGYNSVIITKYGDGFKGPFGEYYPEFPKKFQLEMKYGN